MILRYNDKELRAYIKVAKNCKYYDQLVALLEKTDFAYDLRQEQGRFNARRTIELESSQNIFRRENAI